MSKYGLSKNQKFILIGLTLMVVIIGSVWAGSIWLAPVPDDPVTLDVSTIKLVDNPNLEDVSDFVEVSVWIPKDDAVFDETEDIYTITTNFKEEKSSMDADDVAIDLSDYSYVWIQVDPDAESVYATNWHLIFGGRNYDYTLYVYHQSSDVPFNIMVHGTMAAITASGYQTDGNLTVVMDVPHYTTTNTHVGTNWDIEQSEFDDMTQAEKEFVWDEKNYRCQAPVYVPGDDLEKDYDDDLEKLTDAFALKFTFNTSVSTVDGNAAQINCTVAKGKPIDVVYSGTFIYMIFHEVIDFEEKVYDFDFEMTFAVNISLSNVHSGRLVVPRDDDNLGTFTVYSAIGA